MFTQQPGKILAGKVNLYKLYAQGMQIEGRGGVHKFPNRYNSAYIFTNYIYDAELLP